MRITSNFRRRTFPDLLQQLPACLIGQATAFERLCRNFVALQLQNQDIQQQIPVLCTWPFLDAH